MLTITISRGTTIPSDRPFTVDDLNLLGLPTVSITGGVGAADIALGAVNWTHVTPGPICVGDGTGTTSIAVAASPGPTSHTEGTWLWIVPGSTNTGNATLTINALAPKALKRLDGGEVRPGDLAQGVPALVVYNSTGGYYQLVNPAGPSGLYAVDSGTANAASVTLPWTFNALADLVGVPIAIKKGAAANTASITLAVNGKAATAITTPGGLPLASGALAADRIFTVMYDGTAFRLIGGGNNAAATATASGTELDWALAPTQYRTLSANLTYATFANLTEGGSVTVWITQAASGGPYTVSWDAGLAIKWANASAPAMATTASRSQAYSFWRVDGVTYGAVSANHG